MPYNQNIIENTVPADDQVFEKVQFVEEEGAAIKVLFLGNSITLHEPAPAIGWNNAWGMAASAREKDYVHILLSHLREQYGKVGYCICNVGEWEQKHTDPAQVKNTLRRRISARILSFFAWAKTRVFPISISKLLPVPTVPF